jgi:uncharacterized protein DUF4386
MPVDEPPRSLSPMARAAGALWLVTVATGLFAELFARAKLIVPDSPGATAHKILASETLFRSGLVADLIVAASMAGATVLLYAVFRARNRVLAVAQLGFGFSGCIILAASLPTLSNTLIIITRLAPLGGMDVASLNLLALGDLKTYSIAYNVSLAFFAIQVGLIGVLILKSRLFPRVFGILFLIEAVCNSLYAYLVLLAPSVAAQLYPAILFPGLPAEAGFAAWLLLVGIRPVRSLPKN